jgi:hypothetical protein
MRALTAFTLFSLGLWAIYPSAHAVDARGSSQQAIKLPLTFETNLGQVDARVQYLARGAHGNFFLTRDGVTLTAGRVPAESSVDMWFPGALRSVPTAESATGGVANYFTGKNRDAWVEHAALYARVRYPELYPGIDLVFHGNQDQMEYDFEVAPGVTPAKIELGFRGAEAMHLDQQGNLVLETAHGAIRFLAPRAYQDEKGVRRPVRAGFALSAKDRVGFSVGDYDHDAKLIIDPVVAYATSFAVSNTTQISGVGIDADGDLLFTGQTYAPDYPVAGSGKPSGSPVYEQVVLTKLNPAGDTILYSTYIPSGTFNSATGLSVGQDGSAYVAGITSDPNFPVTSQNLGGCTSICNAGFVAKFDTTGAMVYSTTLGSGQILPHAIIVNAAGNAYVTGLATGPGLLTTPNAFQPGYGGTECTSCNGAFYAELNLTGDHYVFASYYGVGELWGEAIALDTTGNVYIAGTTNGDVPFSGQLEAGIGQMFVAKFSPDGSHLLFGSNFGGGYSGNHEAVVGMGVGTDGTVYLAGYSDSPNFPYLATADRLPIGPGSFGQQIFAAAIDPTLTKLTYSTMLASGTATAAVLDAKNNLWVSGQTGGDTIQTVNALESDGPGNGLIFEVDPTGKIVTSTYFGGNTVPQVPAGIAIDPSGNLYLGGTTTPASSLSILAVDDGISVGKDPLIPVPTTGVYSNEGVLLAKIAPDNRPQISLAGSLPYLYLRNVGTADLHISSIDLGGGLSKTYGNCGKTIPAGHSCALTLGDSNGKVATGTVTINSDALPASQTFTPLFNGQITGGNIGHLLLLDLSQLHLPAQQAGTTSLPTPLRIWNIGVTPATLTSIQVGGSLVETHDCTQTLAAGSYCTVNVSWAPSHSGGNYIQINADTGQQLMLYAPGSGVQGPDPLYFSQQNMNFGNQLVGAAGVSHEVTVTNISNAPASLSSATIGGPSEFAISGNSCTGQLAPHQSCGVTVSFTPAIDGSRMGTLNLSGSSSSASIQLIATGIIASQVTVSPLQLGFDGTVIGGQPYPQQVTLTNTGPGPVSVSGISFSQAIFSETDNCAAPLPVNGTCAIQVTAKPLQPGNFFGTMTISFDGPTQNQILTVSGVAYFPLTTLASSLDFGANTAVGSVSPAQYIEIANGMQTKPQAYTASVTDDFAVDTSKCPSPVPGFWGCPLYVSFRPKTAGLHTGALTLTFPGVSAVETVTLTGRGSTGGTGSTGPIASVPESLDFGSIMLGSNAIQAISIANTGEQSLRVTGTSITGTNAADFTVDGQCQTLAPGANCLLAISFNPSADIAESARLSISDNAAGSPHAVNLTGTGVSAVTSAGSTGPVVSVPNSLDFGNVVLGTRVTQSISISNAGQQPLTVSDISTTGTNAADFSAASGQCATVAAAAKCSIEVSFYPSANISESAQLSIQDNAAGSPHLVNLTGTGVDAVTWATPPSSTTATTNSGGNANYSLSLTSSASATDTIKVTCNGAPQYATCIPNPSSLTLTPGQTAPISVTISTNNATAASAKRATPFNRATLAFAIFLPLLSLSRRRVWKMAALGGVIFMATALSGCGGNNTVTPPPTTNAQTTAPGTYVLQVVASDGMSTQTQKITLIVQ